MTLVVVAVVSVVIAVVVVAMEVIIVVFISCVIGLMVEVTVLVDGNFSVLS